MIAPEIDLFCQHLRTRNYSVHTVANYEIDLHLFFEAAGKTVARITWRDVDRFIEEQYQKGLAATTINRRLHALKRFYDFLVIDREEIASNPVKPSQYLRQGRPLPKKLTPEQVQRLFEQIESPMDRALFLLMMRCGLRVSEVANLKVSDVDWDQQAIWIEQG